MIQRAKFICCLTASLVVPALLVIWLQSGDTVRAAGSLPRKTLSHAREQSKADQLLAAGAAEEINKATEKTAMQFAARMAEWETAKSSDADRIEAELKVLITDENAAAIARALPQQYQGTFLGLMVQEHWTRVDRDAAVRWLESQPEATAFQVSTITRGWIVQDAEGMNRYLDSLPSGPWKTRLQARIAQDAIDQQFPEEALSLARNLDPGDEQTRLLAAAILKLAQSDAKAAVEQIDKLPDPALQEKMVSNVAIGYAMVEPALAADWILQSLAPGEALNQGIGAVIQLWASQHKAAEAAAWVEKLPAGEVQQATLGHLISAWGEFNPEAVRQWVEGLPEGPLRTDAASELAKLASVKN